MKYLILLALLITLPFASALEENVINNINPDSPIYFLDVWFDEFKVSLKQNDLDKSLERLRIADERAIEMKEMALKNKLNYMENAKNENMFQIQEVEKLQLNLRDSEKNQVQERLQKHLKVLERVREQVPEQAKQGINIAIQNSDRSFSINQERISVENRVDVDTIKSRVGRLS